MERWCRAASWRLDELVPLRGAVGVDEWSDPQALSRVGDAPTARAAPRSNEPRSDTAKVRILGHVERSGARPWSARRGADWRGYDPGAVELAEARPQRGRRGSSDEVSYSDDTGGAATAHV